MPVIREQRRVGAVQPGGVIQVDSGQSFAQSIANIGGAMIQGAQQVSRVMVDSEIDEAIAVASNLAIESGENGVPTVDRSARERWGKQAQKAFDRTLEPRFQSRLAVSLDSKLQELSLEFEEDPEGFKQAAMATLEGMTDSVPEDFRGYWGDVTAQLGAKYGAQIGYAAMKRAKVAAADDFDNITVSATETINNAVLAGDDATVEKSIANVLEVGEELVQQGVILQSQLNDAMTDLYATRGLGQLLKTANELEWSSSEYYSAYDALVRGGTRLDSLFPDNGSRAVAMARLGQAASSKAFKEAEEQRAAEAARDQYYLLSGMTEPTKETREQADIYLGTTMEDWGTSAKALSPETWSIIRNIGYLPGTLQGALSAASRPGNMNVEARAQVFRIWRELREGRAPDSSPTFLGDDIPDIVNERFLITAAFMEVGGTDFEQADLFAQEFARNGFNTDKLANAMRAADPEYTDWRPENVRRKMEGWVQSKLEAELGTVILPEDAQMAAIWLGKVLSTDNKDVDEALEMVVGQFKNRYAESEGMYHPAYGRINRTFAAPHNVYRTQNDPANMLDRFFRMSTGLANQLFGDEPLDESLSESIRPWFDKFAEGEIKKHLNDSQLLQYGEGTLTFGTDYVLQNVGADRTAPDYRVLLANDSGGWDMLPFVLSPKAAHAAEMSRQREKFGPDFSTRLREDTEQGAKEMAQMMRNPDTEKAKDWHDFWRTASYIWDRDTAYKMWRHVWGNKDKFDEKGNRK